jgi:hypothetical protein
MAYVGEVHVLIRSYNIFLMPGKILMLSGWMRITYRLMGS